MSYHISYADDTNGTTSFMIMRGWLWIFVQQQKRLLAITLCIKKKILFILPTKVDAGLGTNRYPRENAARPPLPGRTSLLTEKRYQPPRMNNTLRNPVLEDTRRRNQEENMRLLRNQRHDNLPGGASNRQTCFSFIQNAGFIPLMAFMYRLL